MNIPPEKIDEIKTAADIVEVISGSVELKKNGKDHFGLCPFHSEKSPSFSASQEKQMFYCFGCGAAGDVFEFLVKKDGITFPEAVMRIAGEYGVGVEQAEGCRLKAEVRTRNQKPETRNHEYAPEKALPPAEIWQEKAAKLVDWAHGCLLDNPEKLQWLENRGIDIDLVKEFRLGWNPGEAGKDLYRPRESWGLESVYKDDGIRQPGHRGTKKKLWIPVGYIIPLLQPETPFCVERIRIRTERPEPKYYVMPGSGMRCLVPVGAARAYVIIESELDAIMVFGKIRANKVGVVGMGSAQRHPELETYDLLKKAPVILNALDFDQPGRKALEWWEERFPDNHRRWPVPIGKDPGDAFKAGVDIAEWIRAGLPEAWAWKSAIEIGGSTTRDGGRTAFGLQPNSLQPISETFGRSDLLIDKKGGAAQEVSPLKELAALVKSSPVVISVGQGHLKINDAPSWARLNPDKYNRISELVFMNKEVRSYLMGLGSAELDRNNIESRVSGAEKGS